MLALSNMIDAIQNQFDSLVVSARMFPAGIHIALETHRNISAGYCGTRFVHWRTLTEV